MEHATSTGDWKLVAETTPVRELMTPVVTCVTADVSVEVVTALLIEQGFSGVPVVDEDGRPIGMVSKTDLLEEQFIEGEARGGLPTWLGEGFHVEERGWRTVAEVMMPLAFVLPESASIAHAAALMATEGIHRIPLVDDRGKVSGILTTFDLARWIAVNRAL
jgi:CBS domain-containing protein